MQNYWRRAPREAGPRRRARIPSATFIKRMLQYTTVDFKKLLELHILSVSKYYSQHSKILVSQNIWQDAFSGYNLPGEVIELPVERGVDRV